MRRTMSTVSAKTESFESAQGSDIAGLEGDMLGDVPGRLGDRGLTPAAGLDGGAGPMRPRDANVDRNPPAGLGKHRLGGEVCGRSRLSIFIALVLRMDSPVALIIGDDSGDITIADAIRVS
jgi:hypothetical protein